MILIKRLLAAMLLLSLIMIIAGCPDSSSVNPPASRPYGPPMGEITFCEDNREIGTIESDGTGLNFFANSSNLSDLGPIDYGMYWYPGEVSNHVEILASVSSDGDTYSSLKILDQDRNITLVDDEIVSGAFCWSSVGSRVGYIKNTGTEYLIKVYVVSSGDDYSYGSVSASDFSVRRDRPSMYKDLTRDEIVVSLEHVSDPDSSQLAIFNNNATKDRYILERAISPQFSPNGNFVAYIRKAIGNGNPSILVVINEDLDPASRQIFTFDAYGLGATSLAWSPDNTKIAFYAGVNSNDPSLLIADLLGDDISEIVLDNDIAIGSEEDKIWAAPTWNPDEDETEELVLYVENGDSYYNLIVTDLSGNTRILQENLNGDCLCRPDWRNSSLTE